MPNEDDVEDQPELMPPREPPRESFRRIIFHAMKKLMLCTPISRITPGEKDKGKAIVSVGYNWKAVGIIVCKLATDEKYAEVMVEYGLLEFLQANLKASKSTQLTPLCLKILGCLARHEDVMKNIVNTEGLISVVVQQLFLGDMLCLCEAFWIFRIGLEGSECTTWVKTLFPEHIMERVIRIMKNTTHQRLLSNGIRLLSTILNVRQRVMSFLIPSLLSHDLPELLVRLLVDDTRKLFGDSNPERHPSIYDGILLAIEALSVMEGQSRWISLNKELIQLICDLIKYRNKSEVHNARVYAGVILANALEDNPLLALDLSRDMHLFSGLLNAVPITVKEYAAVWKPFSHLLVHISEREVGASSLGKYVSLLVDKSVMIEVFLLNPCPLSEEEESPCPLQWPSVEVAATSVVSFIANVSILSGAYHFLDHIQKQTRDILRILKEWMHSNFDCSQRPANEVYIADYEAVRRLISGCERRLKDLLG